jgi:hypothetical protein
MLNVCKIHGEKQWRVRKLWSDNLKKRGYIDDLERDLKKGKVHPLYKYWGTVQAVRPIGGVEV